MKKTVWCEVGPDRQAIRIFRGTKDVLAKVAVTDWATVVNMLYTVAVEQIRDQVYERSRGNCERCGNIITKNFHMHEKIHRGQGGEISVSNCEALCADCHIGPEGEHGDRRPRFTKSAERVK